VTNTAGPYVVSDTHFHHRRIIQYCDRPFESVQQMDAELISRWNATVADSAATVYHLGDVGFGDLTQIRSQLLGQVHLIQGNHDCSATWNTFTFASRQNYLIVEHEGLRVLLIHYPVHEPDHARRKPTRTDWDVCLYGHVHNRKQGWESHGEKWYLNCSVEVHNYAPVLLTDLLADCPVRLA
jgi:calcineurin-like phosphoesterase family protein